MMDHGSRRILRLQVLARKCTWTLLGHVCLAIAEFGKPQALRTDNEGMFTSRLWQRAMMWAGIRRQRITPHCPWQNGRIERLFGTLKAQLRGMVMPTRTAAQIALDDFAGFYNHARPHQGLSGLTPMEAWHGVSRTDVLQHAGMGSWVQALNGRMVAYRLRI
jgi:transposase InsO family protein